MGRHSLKRIWSPLAQQDLLDIWNHLAAAATPAIADAQLRAIERVSEAVADWPSLGRARDDMRPGLRSIRIERWVIFYRVGDAIEIVRVLDERRDVEMIFSEDA
jgi:toxin ParE1/3/4